jgi:hypothetical protein
VPHVTVFLDVSAKRCYDRVHNMRCRVRVVLAVRAGIAHADMGVRAQDCETGIPLDYLSGLDACYRSFIAQMAGAGSAVVSLDWSDFGSAQSVAREVAAAPLAWCAPSAAVRALVYDDGAVRARMAPLAGQPASVAAADDEVLDASTDATVEESYATPTKSAHAAPADVTVTPPAAKAPRVSGAPLKDAAAQLRALQQRDGREAVGSDDRPPRLAIAELTA